MLLLSEVWCQRSVAVAVLNSDPNGASCRHLSHLIYLSLYCALLASQFTGILFINTKRNTFTILTVWIVHQKAG